MPVKALSSTRRNPQIASTRHVAAIHDHNRGIYAKYTALAIVAAGCALAGGSFATSRERRGPGHGRRLQHGLPITEAVAETFQNETD